MKKKIKFEFLNESDFRNIVQGAVPEEQIKQIYNSQNSIIDSLLLMCDTYKQLMLKNGDRSAGLALGSNIIYSLRRFLLQEDIILSMGATVLEEKQLKIYEGSLTDILKNRNNYKTFNAKKNKEGIFLIQNLENLQLREKAADAQRDSVWMQIFKSQELSGSYGQGNHEEFDAIKENSPGEYKTSSNNFIKLYQRRERDTYVYYGYSGHTILKYYATDKFQFFNRGWLFEHFMERWSKADLEYREYIIEESKREHPVALAIDKLDFIAGYKGGDYRDSAGAQYQAKYNNNKIISYYSINKVVDQIKKILIENKDNNYQKAVDLAYLFTDKNNMDLTGTKEEINNSYNNLLERDFFSQIEDKLNMNVNLKI